MFPSEIILKPVGFQSFFTLLGQDQAKFIHSVVKWLYFSPDEYRNRCDFCIPMEDHFDHIHSLSCIYIFLELRKNINLAQIWANKETKKQK